MFCKHCGAQIPDTAKFCTECGQRVEMIVYPDYSQQQNYQEYNEQEPVAKRRGLPWWAYALLILASVFVLSSALPHSRFNDAPKTTITVDNPINIDYANCNISYMYSSVERDSDPRLFVYYRFTNNGSDDETHYFDYLVDQKAFQDGIQLESSLWSSNQAMEDSNTGIQPGVSITICTAFYLRNLKSDVELTMKTDSLFFSRDLATMTIHIA